MCLFCSAVATQGKNERFRDEKHSFVFYELSSLPFAAFISQQKTYGGKPIMKEHNTNMGAELLSLLRQQRYLYHQLRILTDRQRQLVGTNSPELLLEFISGRRKLVEKLKQLDDKLRPIKTNWQKLSSQIEPEHKEQACEMINQVQEIIGQIQAVIPTEMARNLPLHQDWKFDEIFAEA